MLGKGLEKATEYVGDIAESPVPFSPSTAFDNNPGARTAGEVASNFLPLGIRRPGVGAKPAPKVPTPQEVVISKAQAIAAEQGRYVVTKEDIKAAQAGATGKKMPVEQQSLDLGSSYTPDEIMAARRQAAQGEVQSGLEQQNWLRKELTQTEDMFNPTEDPRLGPASRSPRDRAVIEPGTDVNHLDPIALQRQREMAEGGVQPGDTRPMQGEIPLQGRTEIPPGIDYQKITPKPEKPVLGPEQGELKFGPEANDLVSQKVAIAAGEKKPMISNPTYNKEVAELAQKGTLRPILEHIGQNSENPFYRWLSNTLLDDRNFNTKIGVYDQLISNEGLQGAGKWTGWKEGEIKLSKEGGWHGSEHVVLHEAIHARTVELMWRQAAGLAVPEKIGTALKGIDKLYKFVIANTPMDQRQQLQHQFKNAYEFVAEAFTNKDFQQILSDMNLPKEFFFEHKKEGMMSAFKGFILQIMSILRSMGFKQFNMEAPNALAVILNEGATLIKEANGDPAIAKLAYGPDGIRWAQQLNANFDMPASINKAEKATPQTLKEFKDELELSDGKEFADNYGKFMHAEYMKQFNGENGPPKPQIGYDNRPPAEFKQDLFRTDGTRRINDVGFIFPAGPAYTMAEAHPIIRRAYDQISQANVEKANLFNKWFRGAETINKSFNPMAMRFTGLSTVARTESPNSLAVLGRRMNEKEAGQVMDLINRYGETNPDYLTDGTLLKANGAGPKVIQFLQTLKDTNAEVLKAVNETRVAKGLPEIKENPSWWLTRVRYGSYQVYSIDKSGKHQYLAGFNNFADAEKVAAHMKAEKGVEAHAAPAEYNPKHVEILPSDAFMEAANLIEDPALQKAVRDAAEEAIKRVGVSRYALARDSSASGYVGSKELIDSLGTGKAWEGVTSSIEKYLHQAANYVGSSEAGKNVGAMFVDKQIKDNYPNALARARYMWDQYVGVPRALDELLERASTALSTLPVLKYLGGDSRTGHNLLSSAGSLFTTMQLSWLNPTFYLANAIQDFSVAPRMKQLIDESFGGKGNVSAAYLKATMHMHLPTTETKAILLKALDNGSLEARFAEALDWTQSSESMVPQTIKFIMGEKVAAWADTYARGKAYLSFYELGKSAGLNDDKAHSFAARETQGTMIQYERWARMPVLNKLGPVGDAVAPLTSFVTNMMFRIGDYMKDATIGRETGNLKMGKDGVYVPEAKRRFIAPIMTILGLQVAIAGVKGLPFYDDVKKMWLEANKYYIEKFGGEAVPGPDEWLAQLPDNIGTDILQDGVFSTATGLHMSGTLGMGTVGGNLGQMTGVEYAWNGISMFYTAAENAMSDRMTRGDMFTNGAKVTPPGARETLRAFLHDQPLLGKETPVMQGDELVYTRNRRQQLGALLTGKAPLAEHAAKEARYQFEQLNKSIEAAATQARDRFVDSIIHDEPLPKYVENVFQNYPKSLEGIQEAMDARLIKMNVDYETRNVLKNKADYKALELTERLHKLKNRYENKR
jgi:hypothetical protein